MSKGQAISRLSSYADETIGDIYDVAPDLVEAILALHPGFEYPDWSHRTIGDFLKWVSTQGKLAH